MLRTQSQIFITMIVNIIINCYPCLSNGIIYLIYFLTTFSFLRNVHEKKYSMYRRLLNIHFSYYCCIAVRHLLINFSSLYYEVHLRLCFALCIFMVSRTEILVLKFGEGRKEGRKQNKKKKWHEK